MAQALKRRGLVAGLIAVMVIGAAAEGALGQSRRPSRRAQKPQPGQQAQPQNPLAAAPSPWDDLKPSPYIKRVRPHRWTVTVQMHIGASQWLEAVEGGAIPRYDTWEFDAATLVYPVVGETASSILEVYGSGAEETPAVKGTVELDDRQVASSVTILKKGIGGGLLPSGTWRGQWQIEPAEQGSYTLREMEFEVSVSQVSYRTVFDERGAGAVEWPKGDWPPEAASTFQPQMFVDFDMQGRGYDMSLVTSLLTKWGEGRSVEDMRKQAKPVMLAKWLAGQTAQHVQLSGEGLTFDRTGMWQGFDTLGAANAAATGRGTEIDLPCLLVAIYRAAGIPSRLVIGIDEESTSKDVYLKQGKGGSQIRVWVEFALYDEVNKTFGWVPVDVTRIRKQQSRLPNNYLNRPLEYFGTNDELDRVAPIAFHFHPPTTVRSYGAPAMWGWFVTPTPPGRATQRVRFNINTTPRGGGNESHLPADKMEP